MCQPSRLFESPDVGKRIAPVGFNDREFDPIVRIKIFELPTPHLGFVSRNSPNSRVVAGDVCEHHGKSSILRMRETHGLRPVVRFHEMNVKAQAKAHVG